jgi:DNA recombination protein RmuC
VRLGKHFGDVNEDVRQILISSEKIEKRAGRIEELDFSREPPLEGPRLVKSGGDLLPLQRKLQAGE